MHSNSVAMTDYIAWPISPLRFATGSSAILVTLNNEQLIKFPGV